jgi:hypothetical protein
MRPMNIWVHLSDPRPGPPPHYIHRWRLTNECNQIYLLVLRHWRIGQLKFAGVHRTSPSLSSLLSTLEPSSHRAPPPPVLHRRRSASSTSLEPRWGPSRAPRALLSLLHPRRWALVHRNGRRPSSVERTAAPRSPLYPRRHRSTVDRACPAGPRLYPLKNKSPTEIPCHFTKKTLCFFEINLRSRFADFALRPLYFSEINPQSVIL